MPQSAWSSLKELRHSLESLRLEMLSLEKDSLQGIAQVHPSNQSSARNLLHYLALRRHDIRKLQEQLASLGLSSLGRTESHVLSALCTVIDVVSRLGSPGAASDYSAGEACDISGGREVLHSNTEALLGPAPEGREVRIMVTMPSEAAKDYALVRDLVSSGMNCMRINCAHDGPEAWSGMISNLRRAEKETGKPCRIAMDVAGPKLRTGAIEPGPRVLKYRPKRDACGRVEKAARVWLTPAADEETAPAPADACIPVSGAWLSRLKRGDRIRFKDARGAKRSLTITGLAGKSRWAESVNTTYIEDGLRLTAMPQSAGEKPRRTYAGPIPPREQSIPLRRGDTLVLTRSLAPGRPAQFDAGGQLVSAARIGVALSEFFDSVQPGQPIWFDDGKIGGRIVTAGPDEVTVEIEHARVGGEKLAAEKGINVPETDLRADSLTAEDLKALEFIVKHADIVGYSFVRREQDVQDLQTRLAELGGENLGIILKIETRQGFENLPGLLLAAMRSRSIGVMIARGDLAVECGYQRLAEIQEEILWISEAAHLPVIWATQVLESLAREGIPSRSEITDAAMGERAECVMLNKGPYVVAAVRILDDILRRMQDHQEKKRSMLRKLRVATQFPAHS
jgi:pyruvate kinase